MLCALAIAVMIQASQKVAFGNEQISVQFLKDVSLANGEAKYGSDLSTTCLSYVYDSSKLPAIPDPGDPEVVGYRLANEGEKPWEYKGVCKTEPVEVLSDGKTIVVYQPRETLGVTVLDAVSGTKLWAREARAKKLDTLVGLDGGVVCQWEDGHLTATNARNGTVIWDRALPGRSFNMWFSKILFKSGQLFLNLEGDNQVHLYCIDAKTGEIRWDQGTGVPIYIVKEHYLPGFVLSGDKVVGYEFLKEEVDDLQRQFLFARDSKTGKELWKREVVYTAWPFTPEANESCALVAPILKQAFLYRLSDGGEKSAFNGRIPVLSDKYVVDIDQKDGLVIRSGESGKQISRVQLASELWNLKVTGGKLLLSHPAGVRETWRERVYQVVSNP